jgi:cytochrome c biogenesis protein CcmG/thiol:disulfide interchange protein DsbE
MGRILPLVLIVAAACASRPDLPSGVVRVSGRAPVVSGPLLTGGTFSPSAYRGRVLLVNFFNPFCLPCAEEQPVLERDWRRLHERGVEFVGIHYVGGQWPGSASAARSYLKRMGVTYPVLEDPGSRLARAFAIQGLPSSVIVDRRGRMRFRVLGRIRAGEVRDLLGRIGAPSPR